ncbi:MAG: DUF4388 domain-containing protein, partial [Planctomycetaceae bacterium]|nr:DUF4388 domain-containing protein [Planctomycetaceae bacterium]
APDRGALSGDFKCFGLREIIDFLTNGQKTGLLEVESERSRVGFFVDKGRIQCVTSASVDERLVANSLPEPLKDLAPLLKFTLSTGFSSHAEGIVELLDKRVLDPRLLRALLRHQSAVMTWHCFQQEPQSFNFIADRPSPALFRKTPLDLSLPALLIEGASALQAANGFDEQIAWCRNALRGQNLDRTGLAARPIQVMTTLGNEPVTTQALARQLQTTVQELAPILIGFEQADWIRRQTIQQQREVVVLEPNAQRALMVRKLLLQQDGAWTGKVVRDEFGLQLLLKRQRPDAVLVSIETADGLALADSVLAHLHDAGVAQVGLIAPTGHPDLDCVRNSIDVPILESPYGEQDLVHVLDAVCRQHCTLPQPQNCSNAASQE